MSCGAWLTPSHWLFGISASGMYGQLTMNLTGLSGFDNSRNPLRWILDQGRRSFSGPTSTSL